MTENEPEACCALGAAGHQESTSAPAARGSSPRLVPALLPATALAGPSEAVAGLPAGPVQSLDITQADGTLHLLWGREPAGSAGELFHQRSTDGGQRWSEPVRVNMDQPTEPLGRGKDARLAVHGEQLLAVWTGPGKGPFRSGLLRSARSEDGGRTWTAGALPAPADPARDHAEQGQRFPAIGMDARGAHVIWIDAQPDRRELRHARSLDGGITWQSPQVLDPACCACCPNVLRLLPDGRMAAVYRDVEPSDMRLITSEDAGHTWRKESAVGAFNWYFQGCPHVGSDLVWLPPENEGGPGTLVSVVWTFGQEQRGVFALRSPADSPRWSAPQALAAENPLTTRHPAIARDPVSGRLVAAWQESVAGETAIFTAESLDGGRSWQAAVRRASGSYPRLAASDAGVCLFWQVGSGPDAGIAALPLSVPVP